MGVFLSFTSVMVWQLLKLQNPIACCMYNDRAIIFNDRLHYQYNCTTAKIIVTFNISWHILLGIYFRQCIHYPVAWSSSTLGVQIENNHSHFLHHIDQNNFSVWILLNIWDSVLEYRMTFTGCLNKCKWVFA